MECSGKLAYYSYKMGCLGTFLLMCNGLSLYIPSFLNEWMSVPVHSLLLLLVVRFVNASIFKHEYLKSNGLSVPLYIPSLFKGHFFAAKKQL